MLTKIINGLITICFLAFAVLQFNDPDPIVWVIIYTCIAILAILEIFNFPSQLFTRVLYLALFIYWICYIPDFIAWAQEGFPSITGSMQAENPLVENIREFGGLTIALIVVQYYFFKSFNFFRKNRT